MPGTLCKFGNFKIFFTQLLDSFHTGEKKKKLDLTNVLIEDKDPIKQYNVMCNMQMLMPNYWGLNLGSPFISRMIFHKFLNFSVPRFSHL